MSESTAIALIVIFDVALLGFLAWMMAHPRHLRPHVSATDAASPIEQRARFTREAERPSEAPLLAGLDGRKAMGAAGFEPATSRV